MGYIRESKIKKMGFEFGDPSHKRIKKMGFEFGDPSHKAKSSRPIVAEEVQSFKIKIKSKTAPGHNGSVYCLAEKSKDGHRQSIRNRLKPVSQLWQTIRNKNDYKVRAKTEMKTKGIRGYKR